MTNEELANQFRTKVPTNEPLDYFDRCVDLAIYINESVEDNEDKEFAIIAVEQAMIDAYRARGNRGERSTT